MCLYVTVHYRYYPFNLQTCELKRCCVFFNRKCRHKKTGVEYAVKVVSRRVDCGREVKLLKSCQGHPNIVKLHDVYHDEVQ